MEYTKRKGYYKERYQKNKEKIAEKRKIYYENNKEKIMARNRKRIEKIKHTDAYKNYHKNWKLKNLYGLTREEYDLKLEEQNYKCEICSKEEKLHVDHCHTTGKARGLICKNCNNSLGLIKENIETLEMMIEYIKKYNGNKK